MNDEKHNEKQRQQQKQKRLGPAPIASFEDTSDEVKTKVNII